MKIFVHHEEIDVAVAAEVIAKRGAEKRQLPNPPLSAERRDRLGCDAEALAQNFFAGHRLAILRRTRRPAGWNGMRNGGPGLPPRRPSQPLAELRRRQWRGHEIPLAHVASEALEDVP